MIFEYFLKKRNAKREHVKHQIQWERWWNKKTKEEQEQYLKKLELKREKAKKLGRDYDPTRDREPDEPIFDPTAYYKFKKEYALKEFEKDSVGKRVFDIMTLPLKAGVIAVDMVFNPIPDVKKVLEQDRKNEEKEEYREEKFEEKMRLYDFHERLAKYQFKNPKLYSEFKTYLENNPYLRDSIKLGEITKPEDLFDHSEQMYKNRLFNDEEFRKQEKKRLKKKGYDVSYIDKYCEEKYDRVKADKYLEEMMDKKEKEDFLRNKNKGRKRTDSDYDQDDIDYDDYDD